MKRFTETLYWLEYENNFHNSDEGAYWDESTPERAIISFLMWGKKQLPEVKIHPNYVGKYSI